MNLQIKLFTLFLLLPFIALAEYNGYHIEFNAQLKNGNSIHGYTYLTNIYPDKDSPNMEMFLEKNYEKVFHQLFPDSSHFYYKHRLKYDYEIYEGQKNTIYTVLDKTSIDIKDVERIDVLGIIDQTYAVNMSFTGDWESRNWINLKPVGHYKFRGLLCSQDLFVHETSEKTDRMVKELQALKKTVEEKSKQLENQEGSGREIDDLWEELDNKIYRVIDKYIKDESLKFVVISVCTC